MLKRLIGILEDGNDPSPALPDNARVQLNWRRGEDLTVELAVFTRSNVPVVLAEQGAQLVLNVKRRPSDADVLITKNGVAHVEVGANVVQFAMTPADTKDIPPGLYVYDITMTRTGGKTDFVLPLSRFVLEGSTAAL